MRQPTPALVLSEESAVLGFSRDDRRVVLADQKNIRIWNTMRGQPVGRALSLSNTATIYAALSTDGRKLALCVAHPESDSEAKGEVLLLNAETMEPIAPPLIHDGLPFFG